MTQFEQQTKSKVAVAMSGGVDSSVAAVLLQEQGYQVFGVTMQLWNEDINKTQQVMDSAKRVCDFLKIPFHVMDLRAQFHQQVVKYFLQSQLEGRTPNPCFLCNQRIKWGELLDESIKLGAEFLATGHYAQVIRSTEGQYTLYKGVDIKKDQSYVLAGLTQHQLSRAILPLGKMEKVKVREIARRYSLPVTVDTESQDLCFLGGIEQEQFLAKYLEQNIFSGKILTLDGKLVGEHKGLVHYTIGQRKGLGSGNSAPVYVLKKDLESNTLLVGTKEQLGYKRITMNKVNWLSGESPNLPFHCSLKIRYKATPVYGTIRLEKNELFSVEFDEKVRDATPGQFIVFYDGEQVMGSAEIDNTELEEK